MKTVKRICEVRKIINKQKKNCSTIGFVPTMGYLHKGHLSLVEASVKNSDFTVMSIFVNPVQFGPGEDFERYPRDFERDSKLAGEAGVDLIFVPDTEEMYPEGYMTYVTVDKITELLCGKFRPGHFKGVTTIVSKLFNIISPDRAYFGQKDAQQVAVVRKMVKDLNMNIEIVCCPIVRESDGLAVSSRNVYLNTEERRAATVLSEALFEAKKMIGNGEHSKERIFNYLDKKISSERLARIEYIEIVDAEALNHINNISGKVLIALAVKFGNTRLIDNVIVEV